MTSRRNSHKNADLVPSASRELFNVCGIFLLILLIPLAPVAILYLVFQDSNFFGLRDWPKGVLASGPIAAYVFILYFSFTRIFTLLVSLLSLNRNHVPRHFLGKWRCESRTHGSEKTTSGILTASAGREGLVFAGYLDGEDHAKFATVHSQHCLMNFATNTGKILYRIDAVRKDRTPVSYDCISAGSFSEERGKNLRFTGSWMQINGDEHASGILFLTKQAGPD